jgi:dolichol-phosphate mannosyltransferase
MEEKKLASVSRKRTRGARGTMTIVLPTLNEEHAIGLLIDELKQNGYSNILVVDGHSRDRTVAIAVEKGARVILQHGSGKRDALEKAFRSVKTEYLLVMDADMTYDPRDIGLLLDHGNDSDEVVGARDFSTPHMPRLHRIGNRILTAAFNAFFGTKLRDVCSGMYLVRTSVARKVEFLGSRMAVEEVVLSQICMMGRIIDVSISYRPRVGRKPSTHTWRQGFVDLVTIVLLARRYNPIVLFATFSASVFIPAVILLAYAAIQNFVFGGFPASVILLGVTLLLFATQGLVVATLSLQIRRIEKMLRDAWR